MIIQQIDLYGKLERHRRELGALVYLGVAVSAVALVYVAFAGYVFTEVERMNGEIVQASTNNVLLEQQLAELSVDPFVEANAAIRRRMAELQRERQLKDQVLGVLRKPQQNRRHFSEVLLGLARQHQPGIALSRIHVTGDGTMVNLGGSVTRADLVPTYLYDLGTEAAFAGLNFARIAMSRDDEAGLVFEASSEPRNTGVPAARAETPEELAEALRRKAQASATAAPVSRI